MRFKLKDPAKDAALRVLMSNEEIDRDIACQSHQSMFGLCILFNRDEIKEILDYSPDRWNEYPGALPPEGTLMRLELSDGTRTAGKYFNGEWLDSKDQYLESMNCLVVRYRPWEEK